MSDTVKTEKGTELPLITLKGKKYLQVAYRLQWLTEKYPYYTIDTCYPVLTDTQSVCTAKVQIFNVEGKLIRTAMATKRETKADFNDHTEKAETAAIGRALAMIGLGTQHALSDLEENDRLVDSPLQSVKKDNVVSLRESTVTQPATVSAPLVAPTLPDVHTEAAASTEVPKAKTTFRMPKRPATNGTAKVETTPVATSDLMGLDN